MSWPRSPSERDGASCPRSPSEHGYAIVLVILLLATLLTLALPFLFAVRSQAEASAYRFESARASAAVQSAEEDARGALASEADDLADPLDPVHLRRGDLTPRWDDLPELRARFAPPSEGSRTEDPREESQRTERERLYDRGNPAQVIWSAEVSDERSRIDLNTAPPLALANLFRRADAGRGWVTSLAEDVKAEDPTLNVSSTEGFPPAGLLWVNGELIRYKKREASSFLECERGVAVGGFAFRTASEHPQGTVIFDDRVQRLARWRTQDGLVLRRFQSWDDLRQIGEGDPEGLLPASLIRRLEPLTSFFGDTGVAGTWTRWLDLRAGGAAGSLPAALQPDYSLGVAGATMQVSRGAQDDPADWRMSLIAIVTGQGPIVFHSDVGTIDGDGGAVGRYLVPAPVNVNTAPRDVLIACFQGVRRRFAQPSEAIDAGLAEQLADIVLALRSSSAGRQSSAPFLSMRDYVERFLDPLARISEAPSEWPELEAGQRIALYLNAASAIDGGLETATVPFVFDSGDLFRAHARSASNSPAGATRRSEASLSIFQAAPIGERFKWFGDQRDLEELFRLNRGAHWMVTGPNVQEWLIPKNWLLLLARSPESRLEPFLTQQPPGRSYPFEIPRAGEQEQSDPYAADAEGEIRSWAQLQAVPIEDPYQTNRIWHFEREPEVEGRNTGSDGIGPQQAATTDQRVGIATRNGRLWPFSIGGWFRPVDVGDQAFFQVESAATGEKRGRLGLALEGSELVFRLYDSQGDDPVTPILEACEVRVPVGERFVLEKNTWYHFRAIARGAKPRDLVVLVDGFPLGKARAVTWLTSAVGTTDERLAVDSVEGFPTSGVLRVGDELVEYTSISGKAFQCRWQRSDAPLESAWTGGRNVRLRLQDGKYTGIAHEVGTLVELYGYASMPTTDIPLGGGSLDGDLGPFGVVRVVKGPTQILAQPTTSTNPTQPAPPHPLGTGLEATDGQQLELAATGSGGDELAAFQSGGGLALLVQRGPGTIQVQVNRDQVTYEIETGTTPPPQSTPLLGAEVIRYTGRSGNRLTGVTRNYTQLQRMQGQGTGPTSLFGRARAFVTEWNRLPDGTDPNQDPRNWVWIVPLSVKATQADTTTYLDPGQNDSRRVQIYTSGQDGNTEWIEYDEIHQNHFVRSEPGRLAAIYFVVGNFGPAVTSVGTWPQSQQGWIGAPPQQSWSVASQRIHDVLQFRGRYGTFQHRHTGGATLNPVFAVAFGGFPTFNPQAPPNNQWASLPLLGTRPGRGDRISIRPENAGNASLARYTINWGWIENGSGRYEVALKEPLQQAYPANLQKNRPAILDSRDELVLLKFPSGELPDGATQVRLGSGIVETGGGLRDFNGFIDEIEFDLLGSRGPAHVAGSLDNLATYVLAEPLSEGGTQLVVRHAQLLMSYGVVVDPNNGFLASSRAWPQDAGVLRIGDELLVYSQLDESSDGLRITLARSRGRGFLGTTPRAHGTGDPVYLLSALEVTELTQSLGTRDHQVQLESGAGFWTQGTLLIDDELVHTTRNDTPYANAPTTLAMPRTFRAPRNRSTNGYVAGAYRGRFGTSIASHSNGAVVYRMPFRYWDRTVLTTPAGDVADQGQTQFRIADLAGNSALHFAVSARDSYFQALHWTEEVWGDPNLDVWALVRIDGDLRGQGGVRVAWDEIPTRVEDHRPVEDPEAARDLLLLDAPGDRAARIFSPLNRPGSMLEGKLLFCYRPGSFRVAGAKSNSWKRTPYVEEIGVQYQSESRVLFRESRP
ncbi:MAG: hypothetical protein IPN34_04725 [Planctomycetes bacterium]|nr:hypothetical protein [Planctomycetota bacterium]